jgi:hypothetical protein
MPEAAMLVAVPISAAERLALADLSPATLTEDELRLLEAAGDHFYGAWKGGSKSAGGGPPPTVGAEDAVASLAKGGRPSVKPEDVAKTLEGTLAHDKPIDLTELKVNGTLKFGGDGLGIARKDMPQVPSARLPDFLDSLKAGGTKVTTEKVDPRTIKPAQKEVSAQKSATMMKTLKSEGSKKPVLISKDGYVIDGHHQWGASTALSFANPSYKMPVLRVDMDAKPLLAATRAWTAKEGIATKALGESVEPLPLTDADRMWLAEAGKDSHYYGAWKGGSTSGGGGPTAPEKGWPEPDTSKKGIEDATSAWSGIHYADLREYSRTGRIRPGYSLENDPTHGISKERAAQSVATLTHAIATGPDAPELYRGLRPRKAVAEKFAALKPGSTLDMPLTSWSSSSDQAARYSKGITGRGPTPVTIKLDAGAKGFNMMKHSHYPEEKEWLTNGRFTVKSVSRDAAGGVLVTLTQQSVFVTPSAMKGLR